MLDTMSLYVYEIYKQKSVSAAAEKLFISQPALSNTLKKAEEKLGAPIFNRKTYPFSLTPQGELYIKAIGRMLDIEAEALREIQDISTLRGGKLRIGMSTVLSYHLVPKICESFISNHPKVDIDIITEGTDRLYSLLERDEADVVFLPTYKAPEGYRCISLFEERLVVAVRKDLPMSQKLKNYAIDYQSVVNRSYSPDKELEDTGLLQELKFIYNPPSSSLYKTRRLQLPNTDINPHITPSQNNYVLNHNLMLSGFGAIITTDANIATQAENNRCLYFILKRKKEQESFSVIYNPLTCSCSISLVEEFAKTATEYLKAKNPLEKLKL